MWRELLAVVLAFKQFHQFLLGRHFQLRVHHSALSFLQKPSDLVGQNARWLDFVEEFDFVVTLRAGSNHGNCEALSRRPQREDNTDASTCDAVCRATPHTRSPNVAPTAEYDSAPVDDRLTPEAIAAAQHRDPEISPIIATLRSGVDWRTTELERDPVDIRDN